MSYSLKVTNSSGAPANVAVYQNYPSVVGGLPLVWFNKYIPNGNDNTYSWDIVWALNWGTSDQPLVPGVLWSSGGPIENMQPNSPQGPNAMAITYVDGEFSTINVIEDSTVPPGDMLVTTDASFTVTQAANMSIAVYMGGKPTFAVHGHPNGKTLFDTHPTYYLCTTDQKEGIAVSSMFVSNPTAVVFNAGVTSLSYILNEELAFVPS
jgi:rhizosphere induced protein